jgi:hypothetical protein
MLWLTPSSSEDPDSTGRRYPQSEQVARASAVVPVGLYSLSAPVKEPDEERWPLATACAPAGVERLAVGTPEPPRESALDAAVLAERRRVPGQPEWELQRPLAAAAQRRPQKAFDTMDSEIVCQLSHRPIA